MVSVGQEDEPVSQDPEADFPPDFTTNADRYVTFPVRDCTEVFWPLGAKY